LSKKHSIFNTIKYWNHGFEEPEKYNTSTEMKYWQYFTAATQHATPAALNYHHLGSKYS
jgi:hypothetical protein